MFNFAALRLNPHWLLTRDCTISGLDFLQQASEWATKLPSLRFVVLLCEQHRNFITAFLAAQIRGQTVLLPTSRSPGAVKAAEQEYPDSYRMDDDFCAKLGKTGLNSGPNDIAIPDDHVAALVFTSGSTGQPTPHAKTWSSLVRGAELAQKRFGFNANQTIIATVPPQHMYGMETTIMVPLVCGTRVFSDRPFFPEDVRSALSSCPIPRILVTTPVHLRACTESNLTWPQTELIISATAPISTQQVARAERAFNTRLYEIYGCTEAGSLASRQPALGEAWRLYDDFSVTQERSQAIVSAPHLSDEVPLSDVIEVLDDGTFLLRGRHADMVNIAGKRASLSDLNIKLREIPGVIDGVFVAPPESEGVQARLTALVVAPDVTESQIMAQLAAQIDPAFMPRPLYRVDSLPHNEVGKIPRKLLLALLKRLERVA